MTNCKVFLYRTVASVVSVLNDFTIASPNNRRPFYQTDKVPSPHICQICLAGFHHNAKRTCYTVYNSVNGHTIAHVLMYMLYEFGYSSGIGSLSSNFTHQHLKGSVKKQHESKFVSCSGFTVCATSFHSTHSIPVQC